MSSPDDLSPELQELCTRAAGEKDPEKLQELTKRINQLLDRRFRERGQSAA